MGSGIVHSRSRAVLLPPSPPDLCLRGEQSVFAPVVLNPVSFVDFCSAKVQTLPPSLGPRPRGLMKAQSLGPDLGRFMEFNGPVDRRPDPDGWGVRHPGGSGLVGPPVAVNMRQSHSSSVHGGNAVPNHSVRNRSPQSVSPGLFGSRVDVRIRRCGDARWCTVQGRKNVPHDSVPNPRTVAPGCFRGGVDNRLHGPVNQGWTKGSRGR